MSWPSYFIEWYPILAFVGYVLVILIVGGRVLITAKPVGVTLAWLLLIILIPVVGAILYLLFGESYIGRYRAKRAKASFQTYVKNIQEQPDHNINFSIDDDDPAKPLWDQSYGAIKLPAYVGNLADIYTSSDDILSQIQREIDLSRTTIYLEFYICQLGGRIDQIMESLLEASKRGVTVCLILDSIGSRKFLRSVIAESLKVNGVTIVEALHANPFRILLRRQDLRMHRKLMLFDGSQAYTGSMNLVDPLFFKQEDDVGYWIDLMVRIRGPVVHSMERVFINDWMMEERTRIIQPTVNISQKFEGGIPIQVVPSGPALANDNLIHLLLTAIYSARQSIEITTPYFVPDDAIVLALNAAAQRGVVVSIYLPFKINSFLAKHAGRSFYETLMSNGVRICPFRDGLLHAKCVLIDKHVALLGSVNLDMRSIWLNFEITIVVSDPVFCQKISETIDNYNAASDTLDPVRWRNRSFGRKIFENATRLLSPLL